MYYSQHNILLYSITLKLKKPNLNKKIILNFNTINAYENLI